MKLSDLLFDRRCKLCNEKISDGAVCCICRQVLVKLLHPGMRVLEVDGRRFEARYLFDYGSPEVKNLLFCLKKRANKDLFAFAAELYQMVVPVGFCGCITCPPRRMSGNIDYGYDQVAEPCKMLCKNSGLEYKRLAVRRGFSEEQKKLSQKQRLENTKGRFKIIKKDIPKNILIVDDVITTGSTVVSFASEILKVSPCTHIEFAFLASAGSFSGKG